MSNEELVSLIRVGAADPVELLEQNSGFIRNMALRYRTTAKRNGAADMADLVQSAALGLLLAIDKWDPEKGSFLTIAGYCMRDELCKLLGLKGRQRVENAAPAVSLSSPVRFPDGTSVELVELIPDERQEDMQEKLEKKELYAFVRRCVSQLDSPAREAVQAFMNEGKTTYQYAREHGLDASQLEKDVRRAADRLRKELEAACWVHVSRASFERTRISATEAAVFRRYDLTHSGTRHTTN